MSVWSASDMVLIISATSAAIVGIIYRGQQAKCTSISCGNIKCHRDLENPPVEHDDIEHILAKVTSPRPSVKSSLSLPQPETSAVPDPAVESPLKFK